MIGHAQFSGAFIASSFIGKHRALRWLYVGGAGLVEVFGWDFGAIQI